MGEYSGFYAIFFCVAGLAFLESLGTPNHRANLINLYAVLFLAVIIGFRGDFDSDYEAYVGIYEATSFENLAAFRASFSLNVEALFVILMMMLKVFSFSPQSIFVLSSFVSMTVNWYYCFRRVAFPTLVLLGLLSHALLYREFTEIRHGIAGALCLASFFMLSDGRNRRAFIFQFIAMFFHSATLFVVFFSYLFVRLSRKNFIYFCTLVGLVLYMVGIQGLLDQIGAVVPLPSSVTVYSNSEYDFNLGLLNPSLIKQFFCLLFFLGCIKRYDIKEKLYHDLLTFYYISIVWLFGANEFAMFAGRLASFYGLLDAYLFAMTMAYVRGRLAKLVFFCVLISVYLGQYYLNIEFKGLFPGGDYVFY